MDNFVWFVFGLCQNIIFPYSGLMVLIFFVKFNTNLKERCYKIYGYPPGYTGKKKSYSPIPASTTKATSSTLYPNTNITKWISMEKMGHTLIKESNQLAANMTID